jgi:hypothetical protein
MHVIVHQDVSVQPALKSFQRLQQTLQVLLSIVIVEKTWQPVIASLHHVLRNAGEVESRGASHGPQHRPPYRLRAIRPFPTSMSSFSTPRCRKLSLTPLFRFCGYRLSPDDRQVKVTRRVAVGNLVLRRKTLAAFRVLVST